jgi:hypothetical protein
MAVIQAATATMLKPSPGRKQAAGKNTNGNGNWPNDRLRRLEASSDRRTPPGRLVEHEFANSPLKEAPQTHHDSPSCCTPFCTTKGVENVVREAQKARPLEETDRSWTEFSAITSPVTTTQKELALVYDQVNPVLSFDVFQSNKLPVRMWS